jgi:hypothetical protein
MFKFPEKIDISKKGVNSEKKFLKNFLLKSSIIINLVKIKNYTMSEYLILAKNKFNQDSNVDFGLSITDFIMDCYVRLKPCSYGKRIEQKISKDLNITSIKSSLGMGDVILRGVPCEIKTSFLDKKGSYHLTHLRMWQDFKYYLLCLVDCENNFTPEFYVIEKDILNDFKIGPMNGTKLANTHNNTIELRTTFKKGGENFNSLMSYNKLGGTSFDDLHKFVNEN